MTTQTTTIQPIDPETVTIEMIIAAGSETALEQARGAQMRAANMGKDIAEQSRRYREAWATHYYWELCEAAGQ